MNFAVYTILFLVAASLVFWLRVRPFREKKTSEPERTANAKLTTRRVETGTNRSGRSQGMGYSFLLTFETEAGKQLQLYAYDHEYGSLREGMEGTLTWKGPYFVSFLEKEAA